VAVTLVAAVLITRLGWQRWLGEAPGFRACVAALDAIRVGRPWTEAETHLSTAVAHGGSREVTDPLSHETAPDMFPLGPTTVFGSCDRYPDDSWMAVWIEDMPFRAPYRGGQWHEPPADPSAFTYTEFQIRSQDGKVEALQAEDCKLLDRHYAHCLPHP
jgi:hypothetical protein